MNAEKEQNLSNTAARPLGVRGRLQPSGGPVAKNLKASAEEGATLVEFALSAVVLLSLVFGIIALSMALYSYHFVSYAARAGTRYAIVRGSSCPFALTGCPGYGNPVDVQSYLRSIVYPGIDADTLTVTTTFPTVGPTCTPSITPCDNPGNVVQVSVSYQFPLIIPFVPSRTLTMTSTSQMVISQ